MIGGRVGLSPRLLVLHQSSYGREGRLVGSPLIQESILHSQVANFLKPPEDTIFHTEEGDQRSFRQRKDTTIVRCKVQRILYY